MAIVGQYGSGKSVFLARLIEELLICTQARCIIMDPNADFRLFREAELEHELKKKLKKLKKSPGKIPADNKFRECWNSIDPKVYFGVKPRNLSNWKELKLPWPVLSLDAIATDDDSSEHRDDLGKCHEFVQTICYLMAFKYLDPDQKTGSERDLDI